MSRSFHPNEIIQLPKLSAAQTAALGTAVVSRGQELAALPEAVQSAFDEVRQALDWLRQGLVTHTLGDEVNAQETRNADLALGAAWAALHTWLSGWARLAGVSPPSGNGSHSSGATAARLLAALFPDGLKFTQFAFREEWVASESRLERIRTDALDEQLTELGGQEFLTSIERAHAEFGQALGLLSRGAETQPQISLRQRMTMFETALRFYVVQVIATATPGDDAADQQATFLLEPLMHWRTGQQRGDNNPDDQPGDSAGDSDEVASTAVDGESQAEAVYTVVARDEADDAVDSHILDDIDGVDGVDAVAHPLDIHT